VTPLLAPRPMWATFAVVACPVIFSAGLGGRRFDLEGWGGNIRKELPYEFPDVGAFLTGFSVCPTAAVSYECQQLSWRHWEGSFFFQLHRSEAAAMGHKADTGRASPDVTTITDRGLRRSEPQSSRPSENPP
jgi:hypothetical protein